MVRFIPPIIGRLFFFALCIYLPAARAQESPPADVRLVIDVSGSMKRNDPNNLRQPAVELLVQLLPEKSQAGVWTFGKWVNMLVPHATVNDSWRMEAKQKATDINSVGLYTNIGEALEKAAFDIPVSDSQYRTSIILLTDGMVDIDKSPEKNQQEWRRIVDAVIPRLKASGVTVHTIALSDNADSNLLTKLSLATDGMAEVAHSADDLMGIFLKAFDAAAPAEQVPLSDNQFVIDSSVEEFTALIFRQNADQPTELIGPDQTVYAADRADADVKWHRADNYDLITVRQPLEGEWGVRADMAPDSRVTVVSNLNIRVRPLPLNVFKGQLEELSLELQEDGKTIVRPEFLRLMDVQAIMEAGNDEFDLRQFWQAAVSEGQPPADGRYTRALPGFDKDGIYQLSVVVDGKTFLRQFNHQFHVRQPFGAEVKQVVNEGRTEYVLIASAYSQDIDVGNTQLVATIQSPDGRKKIRPLTATESDTWQATLMPDNEGQYTAQVKAKGTNTQGEPFEATLDPVTFIYTRDGGFSEEKPPFFEPTATPAPTPESATEDSADATQPEEPPAAPVPAWLLYSILGLGNLIIFALGFFAFRKIMGSNDKVLEEYSDEKITEPVSPDGELDAEEEPPMEDLEPAMAEPPPMPDMPDEDDDLEMPDDDDLDMADDLDAMAGEDSPEDAEAPSDDDDDMVAEMLKAQGLDLAEDELDEAISTLIDDLDAGADDDDDPDLDPGEEFGEDDPDKP